MNAGTIVEISEQEAYFSQYITEFLSCICITVSFLKQVLSRIYWSGGTDITEISLFHWKQLHQFLHSQIIMFALQDLCGQLK